MSDQPISPPHMHVASNCIYQSRITSSLHMRTQLHYASFVNNRLSLLFAAILISSHLSFCSLKMRFNITPSTSNVLKVAPSFQFSKLYFCKHLFSKASYILCLASLSYLIAQLIFCLECIQKTLHYTIPFNSFQFSLLTHKPTLGHFVLRKPLLFFLLKFEDQVSHPQNIQRHLNYERYLISDFPVRLNITSLLRRQIRMLTCFLFRMRDPLTVRTRYS